MLSRVFRGKFIDRLKRAFAAGELSFFGRMQPLAEPENFEQMLTASVQTEWVVYAKRPFGGPKQVLKYLARYTHRVAISNQRLIALQDGQVRFRYRDYAAGQALKEMTVASDEFIRRFLLHALPSGFVRIRYYGFLANRHRAERLDRCRVLLGCAREHLATTQRMEDPASPAESNEELPCCPLCRSGKMLIVEVIVAPRMRGFPRSHLPNVPVTTVRSDTS